MNGKECRATRREIDESELSQRLSDQALSHLAVCASCSSFRTERTSLRELVGSLEPVAAPGDFDMRLRARIANEQSRARQPFIFRFVTSTPAIAAAALVVMLATSLVWFAQRNKTQRQAIATAPPTGLSAPAKVAPSSTGSQTLDSSATPGPEAMTLALGNDQKPARSNRDFNTSRQTVGKPLVATDYSVSGADSIRQMEQKNGEVSLSAPLRPMVVSMQDDRGGTRKISLPPVTFGAQRLVDNLIPVGSKNSRSW